MSLLVMIAISSFIIILFEVIPVIKSKQWKCFWLYAVMLLLAWGVGILTALNVKVPSPAGPIKDLINLLWQT